MKGAGINALRVETLNRFVSNIPKPKENFFSNLFNTAKEESDTVRWMFESGSIGMTPFVAPGSPAPVTKDDIFWREGSARAAYYKEKRFFDEVFLNNMLAPEASMKYEKAEKRLAKMLARLKYRCERRREWMIVQMMTNGSMSYTSEKGLSFTVDYGIPAAHKMALTTAGSGWNKGTTGTCKPIRDMYDMKDVFANEIQAVPKYTVMNSTTLNSLLFNGDLQSLLKKSAFGDGDLFSRPAPVLASLLGVGNIQVYDDLYTIRSYVASSETLGATSNKTITVESVVDMEKDTVIRIYDMKKDNSWFEREIDSIDYTTNVITVKDLAGFTAFSLVAGQHVVEMRKKFVPDWKVMMFTDEFEGEKVAEFMEAPFGVERHYGLYADRHFEWDPDGVWVRVQDKGLPVLYNPNTIVTLNTYTAT